MEKSNLEFWNKVEKTNPKHTTQAKKGGRTLTAINAQHQIKNATEQWGQYGDKWGLKDIDLNYIDNLDKSQILCVSKAVFYYPGGSFEIGSSIFVQRFVKNSYLSIDDDFLKKLETDMTTKALSKLGFNADVFMGRYDDNKYVSKLKEEFRENSLTIDKFNEYLENCTNSKGVKDLINKFDLSTEQKDIAIKKGIELKEKENK